MSIRQQINNLTNERLNNYMNDNLTWEEWEKLSREAKRKALLQFREPENLYRPNKNYKDLRKEKV